MKNVNNLNLSRLSSEMEFLLYLLGEREDEYKGSDAKIDWQHFIKLTEHHRVFPTIYPILKRNNFNWIPTEVIDNLYKKVHKNTLYMLYMSGESELLFKLFKNHMIRTLFLKGTILALDLYGDLSLRTSSDIDILVSMKDLKKVETILSNEGFIKDEYIQTVLNDWKWRHHHFTYFHPKKKIKLEVHWRFNPGPASEPSFEELWKRRRTINGLPSPIFTLGKEDQFLFLVLHGARHGWSRLRWLVDIKYLCKQQLDWNIIKKLLKKYYYYHIGEQTLVLVNQLLNLPLEGKGMVFNERKSSFRLAQLAIFYLENMVNLHDDKIPSEVADYHKNYLFALMSWQQKSLFILSVLYPYPMDKETLPLPQFLHFLYFPLRPFLFAWRKARKEVLTQGD